jgi:hypothetical protein
MKDTGIKEQVIWRKASGLSSKRLLFGRRSGRPESLYFEKEPFTGNSSMGQFAVTWRYLGRCGWVPVELGRFNVSTGITSKSKSKGRMLS